MQKPMNRTVWKRHMAQISTPLFSPAIAPEGAARSQRAWPPGHEDLFRNQLRAINGIRLQQKVKAAAFLQIQSLHVVHGRSPATVKLDAVSGRQSTQSELLYS